MYVKITIKKYYDHLLCTIGGNSQKGEKHLSLVFDLEGLKNAFK